MGRAPPGDARHDERPRADVDPRGGRHRVGASDRVDGFHGSVQGRVGGDVGDEGRHRFQWDEHAGREAAHHHDERGGAVGVLALDRVAARQADERTQSREGDDDRCAGHPCSRRHLRAGRQAEAEGDEGDECAQCHEGGQPHNQDHPRLDGGQRVHARDAGRALDGQRRTERASDQDDAVRRHHDDHCAGHVPAPGLGRARNIGHAEHRVHEHGEQQGERHVPRVEDV